MRLLTWSTHDKHLTGFLLSVILAVIPSTEVDTEFDEMKETLNAELK